MTQKRIKRTVRFELSFVVYTDFMETFLRGAVRAVVEAMGVHEASRGRLTEFQLKELK